MRILVLGSGGLLGGEITAALAQRHEVLGASRSHAKRRADLANEASLMALLQSCRPLDAVVCTAGEAPFARLESLDTEAISSGLRVKLLGQIALARLALTHVSANGSVTLTSGLLNYHPIAGATCAAMTNGALEGFVRAAALESRRGVRINIVSPGVLKESWDRYGAYFNDYTPIRANVVARAYVRAVEGSDNGQVLAVHEDCPVITDPFAP